MTGKRKNRIRWWHIPLGITAVIACSATAVWAATAPGRTEVINLTFSDVNFGELKDGTYTGSYRGEKDSFRDTDVEVTIESGKVINISATGGMLAGDKQTDEIKDGISLSDFFESVIERETIHVDAISGATLTSKSYLKAVEDALLKAENK